MESSESTQQASTEQINELVMEHRGWAESIARAVARAWNMDAESDGMCSAAMEALLFCARRFDVERGVPFRGYARKRIHEASTEEARKNRGWKSGGNTSKTQHQAREISAQLLEVFPEVREGQLPFLIQGQGGDSSEVRSAIRQLLMGATLLSSRQSIGESLPDDVLEYKRMIEGLACLEPVHQVLLWKTYWEGMSLRGVAAEWETDELNVMREHKALLSFMQKSLSAGRSKTIERLKVRPALRGIALDIKREQKEGPFAKLVKSL